ncbi:MAG: DUF3891 family protein [Solirubrobacteraceae bacterium]
MLISRRRGRLQLVTHPDHGRLAGELCEQWGNDRFQVPAPGEALLTAAIHHDDGWGELDDRPAFNESQARPAHFLELALPDTAGPYARGVDTIYARDPYAGALVSMHWAGLYRTRWGLQGGAPVGHPLAAEIVAVQERRWTEALRDAWAGHGLRSEFEAATWHAYEVLQALDFISLALSLLDLGQPTEDADAVAMPPTLPTIDQPPGGRVLPNVPTAAAGEHVDVSLQVTAAGHVTLDPYPLASPRVELTLPARELEDRRFASEHDAAAAFHAAAPEPRTVVVEPAS